MTPDAQSYVMRPVMSVADALAAWDEYQELKTKIAQPEDFKKIGDKLHPMKSFVRKAQKFFGVSCEVLRDEPWKDGDEVIGWIYTVRAVHGPTGLYQDADGACEFSEKNERQRTLHNVRAHALTRAKNRATLDLVGFGEVSAEEIIDEKQSRRSGKKAPKNAGASRAQQTEVWKAAQGRDFGEWDAETAVKHIIAKITSVDPEEASLADLQTLDDCRAAMRKVKEYPEAQVTDAEG